MRRRCPLRIISILEKQREVLLPSPPRSSFSHRIQSQREGQALQVPGVTGGLGKAVTITDSQPVTGASAHSSEPRTVCLSAGDVRPCVQNGISCNALAGTSSAGSAGRSEPAGLCELGRRLRSSE
ncbi:hypothetical protein SKAU_G00030300 [Synaphobranchus kaupii]|uniref:Uncharacterized protein n=1 Tax=Synaphobranchus kaupii TaxID=118154 RepID=A0A9Q1GE52_SYNKA|nr:hypothetical protein SKAU_G00030300 [Synaphobranchus kaupii]